VRVHDLSVPGNLSRVSWKLSRTVLRGGTSRKVGPLLGAKEGKQKSPFCFSMADDSIFAFAGIWDRWRNPDTEWVETCSIITTSANALLAGIHDRMPVIMKRESYDLWLDPGFSKADVLLDFLKPFPADAMCHHRVRTRVNSVKNDDPACAEEFIPTLLF
jgi:putative SOS response-associated peptidase YedK